MKRHSRSRSIVALLRRRGDRRTPPPPAKTMYEQALEREDAVRAALSSPEATPRDADRGARGRQRLRSGRAALSDQRLQRQRAVAGGTAVARRVREIRPAAGQDAGVRLLRRLATAYPTSKLAKQVPEQLARVDIRSGPPGPESATPPWSRPVDSAGSTLDSAGPAGADAPPSRRHAASDCGSSSARASKIATIKDIRRAVTRRQRARDDRARRRSAVPRRADRRSGACLRRPAGHAAPRRRFSIRPCASISTRTSCGRSASDGIRTTRRAWSSTPTASPSYSVYPLYSPYRLVIDCVRLKVAATAAEINLANLPAVSHAATAGGAGDTGCARGDATAAAAAAAFRPRSPSRPADSSGFRELDAPPAVDSAASRSRRSSRCR